MGELEETGVELGEALAEELAGTELALDEGVADEEATDEEATGVLETVTEDEDAALVGVREGELVAGLGEELAGEELAAEELTGEELAEELIEELKEDETIPEETAELLIGVEVKAED